MPVGCLRSSLSTFMVTNKRQVYTLRVPLARIPRPHICLTYVLLFRVCFTYLFPNWVTGLRRDLRPLGPTVPKPRYPGKSILSSRSNPLSLFVSASIDAHTIPTRRWCILRCWYGRTRTSSRIFRDPIYCDATLPPTLAGSPYPLRTAASWLARNT